MAQKEKRQGGGGKQQRSETVTVRLDPKLRYLADLAARKQRRTLSSFIEWAIEESLRHVVIFEDWGEGEGYGPDGNCVKTIQDEVGRLWDIDEAERFTRLAILYPELLTHREQGIWKLLSDSRILEIAKKLDSDGVHWDWALLQDAVFPMLREYWASLIASYEEGGESATTWVVSMRQKFGKETNPKPTADDDL